MTQKLTLSLLGALIALAGDYVAFRKAQLENPDIQFDWALAISRLIMGLGTGFGIGELNA